MPSTRSATSERPEENRQQLEEKAGTLQQESLTGHQMSWMTTIRDKVKREKERKRAIARVGIVLGSMMMESQQFQISGILYVRALRYMPY
ncbi:hypothetical protein T02_11757 [Trichinella nativa]|uniref:Uncharacterized protein n=1 Tax=Trichinella nativa TaxID=6335 RepID=A0A0V1KK62_9BILA|nr:hypothetical protein T02_2821 [Trichinella nativa]KRZ47719.1 hypothetical protein T02_1360 [Trichinella nativa]KRZ48484.1 hypothetical protein T02_15370 [Trichinella nativa]KRZ51488.1 hypothetical protein T02_11757 [Trichinella nativa]